MSATDIEAADANGRGYLIRIQPMDRLRYDPEDWYGYVSLDALTWLYRKIRHRGCWRITLRETPIAPVQRQWRKIVHDKTSAEELASLIRDRLAEGASVEAVVTLTGLA